MGVDQRVGYGSETEMEMWRERRGARERVFTSGSLGLIRGQGKGLGGIIWSKVAVYIMGDKVRRVVVVWH